MRPFPRTCLLIAGVFAAAFGAHRVLSGTPSSSAAAPSNAPPPAATTKQQPPATQISSSAAPPADVTGWLRLAQTGDPLEAEAALIEALRPLGHEKWASLFRELTGPGLPEETATRIRQSILRLWSAEAPDAALAAVRGSRVAAEIEIVASAMLARDGAAAETTFRPLLGPAGWHAWATFGRWALDHAPDKVGDALLAAKRAWPDAWTAMPDGLLAAWFRRDPDAVFAWLKGDEPEKLVGSYYAASSFAAENEPLTRQWFATLGPQESKGGIASNAVGALMHQGKWEQASWWMLHAEDVFAPTYQLARGWAASDLPSAQQWALERPTDSDARRSALSGLAEAMAEKVASWDEANALLQAIPDADSRRAVTDSLLQHLPPTLALDHLSEASPDQRAFVVAAILRGQPPLPLDDAIALADREASRSTLGFSSVADRLYDERGPAAAFDWIAKQNTPDDLITVTNRWAETDPRAAAEALWRDTGTEDKSNVFMNLAAMWMAWDVEGASAWFAGLPAGSARDAAAPVFVQQLHASDPGAAVGWAASIGDAEQRHSTLTNLASWLRRVPEEKWREALDDAPLTDSEKAIFTPDQQ